MKTIATAAVLLMLSAPGWADEAEKQTNDHVNEPIVLSEAEMDGVTAGINGVKLQGVITSFDQFDSSSSTDERSTEEYAFNYAYFQWDYYPSP